MVFLWWFGICTLVGGVIAFSVTLSCKPAVTSSCKPAVTQYIAGAVLMFLAIAFIWSSYAQLKQLDYFIMEHEASHYVVFTRDFTPTTLIVYRVVDVGEYGVEQVFECDGNIKSIAKPKKTLKLVENGDDLQVWVK